MRLSAAGLAGSAAHPPLRGRPQTRRRIRDVTSQSNIIERPSPRSGRTRTAPLHGATPTRVVAASRAMTRLSRQRRCAASRSECASVARPARREARVPAGQLKNAAPSRSAKCGKVCVPRQSRTFSERSRSSPEGPRLQAWCAQRIERVAVRQRQSDYVSGTCGPYISSSKRDAALRK